MQMQKSKYIIQDIMAFILSIWWLVLHEEFMRKETTFQMNSNATVRSILVNFLLQFNNIYG